MNVGTSVDNLDAPASGDVHHQAIHREWERCHFCHGDLDDLGAGFFDHLEESPLCRVQYEDWKTCIDQDWGGG